MELCAHDGCNIAADVRVIVGGDQHQTVAEPRCAEHLGVLIPALAVPGWELPAPPISATVEVDTSTVTSNQVRELLALVLEREARQEQRVARANELLFAPALGAYRQREAGIEV